jgi:hypothetical protein
MSEPERVLTSARGYVDPREVESEGVESEGVESVNAQVTLRPALHGVRRVPLCL